MKKLLFLVFVIGVFFYFPLNLNSQNPVKVLKAFSTVDTNYLKQVVQSGIEDQVSNIVLKFNANAGEIIHYKLLDERKTFDGNKSYIYECETENAGKVYFFLFYVINDETVLNTIYYSQNKDFIFEIMHLMSDSEELVDKFFRYLVSKEYKKIKPMLASGLLKKKDELFSLFDDQTDYYGTITKYSYYSDWIDDSLYDFSGYTFYKIIIEAETDKDNTFYIGLEFAYEKKQVKLDSYYYAPTAEDILESLNE